MKNSNNKLIKVIPLFLILIFLTINFLSAEEINPYINYSFLAITFIISISIIIYNQGKDDNSKQKMKKQLKIFFIAILISMLMSVFFIFKQS